MVLETAIRERINEWQSPPYDEETIAEIRALADAGDEKELYDRFYTDLEFGTGGLRGVMGAGLNRMNRYTVGRATQGLANYLRKTQGAEGGPLVAVIAHDSRRDSDVFAREAACVFAGNGIKAYLFDALRPTPELSFAVRYLGASAGLVITASHNPKEYNGCKVYWNDGGQVVPPHDQGIIAEVRNISGQSAVWRMDYQEACREGLIAHIGSEMDEAYYAAIQGLSPNPHLCATMGRRLSVVYTPLHGSGIMLVPEALRRWGFPEVHLCASQSEPDGAFPNAPSPNPEEAAALQAAIEEARRLEAHLVLATDPDADRVGIAVRHGGEYPLISGNYIAAMLVEYVLAGYAKSGGLPSDARVVKTIVTSELLADIAGHYGVLVENTLTGFKWIGEKIRLYEESGVGRYLVGGEESYGYLIGTHARDKDAVVASCLIAEMALESLSRGETLVDRLDSIFCRFGVYQDSQFSMPFPGAAGQQRMEAILSRLRASPPQELGGSRVTQIEDYLEGTVRGTDSGSVVGQTGLPRSNVLVFRLEDGSQITARPSGTEPKIKFYFSVCDKEGLPVAGAEALAARKQNLAARHDRLRGEFRRMLEAAG